MASVIRIGIGLALAYLVLVAAAYLWQRKLTYYPDPTLTAPGAAGVPEMEVVSLTTNDGLELQAWYAPPSPGRPVVLYVHGNAGNIAGRGHKVRPYLDAGYGVLLVEYRGYGGNPGSPSEAGLYSDARAGFAFLAKAGIAPEEVVLYGESLGAAVAVEVALGQSLKALVLEAPFTSLADIGALAYPYLPVRLLAREGYRSAAKIGRVRALVVIVHGEADRTVPVAMGRAMLKAAPEPKFGLFLPGLGHNNLGDSSAPAQILAILEDLPAAPEP